jgi:putative DNA primase/helicase
VNDHLDFSPLSDTEREAAKERVHKDRPEADRPMPPPADAEAPEVAASRLFGRPPDALWPYRDVNCAVLFWVCRWNVVEDGNSEKQIRPQCWFADGGWHLAHWPAPRPLYNLNEINSHPNAQVVVCEGEKAADAASRIFPNSVAATSCGGAQATHLSDWAPLERRQVLIWPDNDPAGEKYARDVAIELKEFGCDILMVDVAALVAIDGGARGNSFDPVGWDAADAFTDWSDHDALRETAARLAEPFDQGPNYVSFGPYTMNVGGLMVKKIGSGDSKRTETAWISAPFEVLGACRDPQGHGWGKMLRWRDADGREHVCQVADHDLHGDPAMLCAKLADVGLRIERKGQRDFADYLSVVDARSRVTVVPPRASFVLPGETIGGRGSERVILDPTGQGLYEARATIDDWRNGVALLARGQLLPVLAISTALSGPLLHLIGLEGGGVHSSDRRQSERRRC